MDIDLGVAYIKEPSGNRIKVTMNEFKGQIYVHIREYMLDGDTLKLYPTKSGYAMTAENLDCVIELLEKASKILAKKYKYYRQEELPLDLTKEE